MGFNKCAALLGVLILCFFTATPAFAGRISEPEIQKAVLEYVRDHTSWREDQIEVSEITPLPSLILPATSVRYEVRSLPRSSLLGRTDFEITVFQEGERIHFFRVTAHLTVWVDVLLTSHPIKGGEVIGESDIYVGKRSLADLPAAYLTDPSEISGMKARYFIGANTVLFEGNVKASPIFQKGDQVSILAESESLRIQALGEAKEDGYKGKTVRVMNLQSKKELRGEVIDDGSVRIRF